jgi:hypothetical protein
MIYPHENGSDCDINSFHLRGSAPISHVCLAARLGERLVALCYLPDAHPKLFFSSLWLSFRPITPYCLEETPLISPVENDIYRES